MPPAPGNIASGEACTKPAEIGCGSVVIRRRCSALGICWVAEIHAFDRARAMPPGPPWSRREAVISAPLAPDDRDAAAQAELLGLVDGALDEGPRLGAAAGRAGWTSPITRPDHVVAAVGDM